jgi:hypothetical protein
MTLRASDGLVPRFGPYRREVLMTIARTVPLEAVFCWSCLENEEVHAVWPGCREKCDVSIPSKKRSTIWVLLFLSARA